MSDAADAQNEALIRAYHVVFGSPDGQIVLEDLAGFCRAAETCFHPDPRVHAVAEGRREVFLRIQERAKLSQDQVLQMVARRFARPPSGEDE